MTGETEEGVDAIPVDTKFTRPADALPPETICEHCGVELGDWWGVTSIDHDAPIGQMLVYKPLHSECWWELHPDAVERENARLREVNKTYTLERKEREKKVQTGRKAG